MEILDDTLQGKIRVLGMFVILQQQIVWMR